MDDNNRFKIFVKDKIELFHSLRDKILVIIVANKGKNNEEYTINRTMDAILRLCMKYEVQYDYFLDENDFIKYILRQKDINNDKTVIIYNRSLGGSLTSRRILIPAFCSFNNLLHIGNNAYQMGLLCNKFHYYTLFKSLNIPVADFWCYYPKMSISGIM